MSANHEILVRFFDTFQCWKTHTKQRAAATAAARRSVVEAVGNLCEVLSHFQVLKGPCRQEKRNRELESVHFSQVEKERFYLTRKAFMTTLKRKLNELFKDDSQLRPDYLRQRLNRTRENGKEEMLILLFMSRQLESQRMELCQANQLTDQAQKEKKWLFVELDRRNAASQEDRAKDCQEMKNYEEFAAEGLKELLSNDAICKRKRIPRP